MDITDYFRFRQSSKMKRKTVRVRDISVSYILKEAEVTETTIVFIHGFPFNKNTWIPQLQDLPPSVRAIAVDVRGHGNTTSGHGFFSIDVFANDLLAFIKSLGLEKIGRAHV